MNTHTLFQQIQTQYVFVKQTQRTNPLGFYVSNLFLSIVSQRKYRLKYNILFFILILPTIGKAQLPSAEISCFSPKQEPMVTISDSFLPTIKGFPHFMKQSRKMHLNMRGYRHNKSTMHFYFDRRGRMRETLYLGNWEHGAISVNYYRYFYQGDSSIYIDAISVFSDLDTKENDIRRTKIEIRINDKGQFEEIHNPPFRMHDFTYDSLGRLNACVAEEYIYIAVFDSLGKSTGEREEKIRISNLWEVTYMDAKGIQNICSKYPLPKRDYFFIDNKLVYFNQKNKAYKGLYFGDQKTCNLHTGAADSEIAYRYDDNMNWRKIKISRPGYRTIYNRRIQYLSKYRQKKALQDSTDTYRYKYPNTEALINLNSFQFFLLRLFPNRKI